MKFIAIGTNLEEELVVVVLDGTVTIQLSERAARKLADDILSNANYLWPIEQENT